MRNTLTCLLIDDDEDDHEFFNTALREINGNFVLISAKTAIHGLNILNDQHNQTPDIIFIDLHMPGMNGVECLLEIKKIENLKSIPAYLYASGANPVAGDAMEKAGAAGLIAKRSSIREIREELERIIGLPETGIPKTIPSIPGSSSGMQLSKSS